MHAQEMYQQLREAAAEAKMCGLALVVKCLGLKSCLDSPGDGRSQARPPASVLVGALLMGQLLRCFSFAGVASLLRSSARSALGVGCCFGDDSLSYFPERLEAIPTWYFLPVGFWRE
jgi:hypothetical protein